MDTACVDFGDAILEKDLREDGHKPEQRERRAQRGGRALIMAQAVLELAEDLTAPRVDLGPAQLRAALRRRGCGPRPVLRAILLAGR
eukprot:8526573-Heterocapsa_arctica.AAC.1